MRTGLHARPKAVRRSLLAFGCIPLFWNTSSTSRLAGTRQSRNSVHRRWGRYSAGCCCPAVAALSGAPVKGHRSACNPGDGRSRRSARLCAALPIGWRLWLWTACGFQDAQTNFPFIRICGISGHECSLWQVPPIERAKPEPRRPRRPSGSGRGWWRTISQASMTSARLINTELATQPLSRRAKLLLGGWGQSGAPVPLRLHSMDPAARQCAVVLRAGDESRWATPRCLPRALRD